MMPMSDTASAHVVRSNEVCEHFFHSHAHDVASACHAMAKRFKEGGRLFAYGEAAQQSDVAHLVVEFVHPVIVGKRALPAIALPELDALRKLQQLSKVSDIVIVLSAGALTAAASALIARATVRGLLVLALTGGTQPHESARAEYQFAVPSDDADIVQETHELLYHVLWELVHVFIDHRELPA